MSQFNAHFRNINGDDTYPLTDVIYRSKVDGSLLDPGSRILAGGTCR